MNGLYTHVFHGYFKYTYILYKGIVSTIICSYAREVGLVE